jgi:hypothetical protein
MVKNVLDQTLTAFLEETSNTISQVSNVIGGEFLDFKMDIFLVDGDIVPMLHGGIKYELEHPISRGDASKIKYQLRAKEVSPNGIYLIIKF